MPIKNPIQILPQKVADQIAAGEVVERPASVIKELLENSLDAGAKFIEINLRNGGKEAIKITDDGFGMTPENAKKSVLRHATSKIQKVDDLFSVQTFGFRGEALAAICAVSKFQLVTRSKTENNGTKIEIIGDQITHSHIGSNVGTTVIVEDLFFTTPARKQYLKSESVEYRAIVREIKAFALAHFSVGFRLFHQDKKTLDYPAVESSATRVFQVMKKNKNDFVTLETSDKNLKITGFIGRPEMTLTNRNQQFLFVNGRHVEDYKLNYAIREGYNISCGIEKHRFPISVLFLTIEPLLVDVNVHPRKTEVKFSEPYEVFDLVKKTVYDALSKASSFPVNNSEYAPNIPHSSAPISDKIPVNQPSYTSSSTSPQFRSQNFLSKNSSQKDLFSASNFNQILSGSSKMPESSERVENSERNHLEKNSDSLETTPLAEQTLGELKCIGQVNQKYILAEGDTGLFIFDQHALHERQRFEFFWKKYQGQNPKSTPLLIPEKVALNEELILVLCENKKKLIQLGFVFTFPADHIIEISAVPDLVKSENFSDLIGAMADYFEQDQIGEHKIDQLLRRMIEYKACRGAVMFGDKMHQAAMEQILNDLQNTKFKWLCAHGRPNYVFFPFDDLDRQFHR